jgi:H+/Cl- antiporter ClcA
MKIDFEKNEFTEHMRLSLLAVLVGLLGGLASVGFKIMIGFFQNLFWRAGTIVSAVSSQPWYVTILIPALGGLIIGPIIYYGAREAKGHGVPEIMESLFFRGVYRTRRSDRSDQLQPGIIHRKIVPNKRARDANFGCGWSSGRDRRNL